MYPRSLEATEKDRSGFRVPTLLLMAPKQSMNNSIVISSVILLVTVAIMLVVTWRYLYPGAPGGPSPTASLTFPDCAVSQPKHGLSLKLKHNTSASCWAACGQTAQARKSKDALCTFDLKNGCFYSDPAYTDATVKGITRVSDRQVYTLGDRYLTDLTRSPCGPGSQLSAQMSSCSALAGAAGATTLGPADSEKHCFQKCTAQSRVDGAPRGFLCEHDKSGECSFARPEEVRPDALKPVVKATSSLRFWGREFAESVSNSSCAHALSAKQLQGYCRSMLPTRLSSSSPARALEQQLDAVPYCGPLNTVAASTAEAQLTASRAVNCDQSNLNACSGTQGPLKPWDLQCLQKLSVGNRPYWVCGYSDASGYGCKKHADCNSPNSPLNSWGYTCENGGCFLSNTFASSIQKDRCLYPPTDDPHRYKGSWTGTECDCTKGNGDEEGGMVSGAVFNPWPEYALEPSEVSVKGAGYKLGGDVEPTDLYNCSGVGDNSDNKRDTDTPGSLQACPLGYPTEGLGYCQRIKGIWKDTAGSLSYAKTCGPQMTENGYCFLRPYANCFKGTTAADKCKPNPHAPSGPAHHSHTYYFDDKKLKCRALEKGQTAKSYSSKLNCLTANVGAIGSCSALTTEGALCTEPPHGGGSRGCWNLPQSKLWVATDNQCSVGVPGVMPLVQDPPCHVDFFNDGPHCTAGLKFAESGKRIYDKDVDFTKKRYAQQLPCTCVMCQKGDGQCGAKDGKDCKTGKDCLSRMCGVAPNNQCFSMLDGEGCNEGRNCQSFYCNTDQLSPDRLSKGTCQLNDDG